MIYMRVHLGTTYLTEIEIFFVEIVERKLKAS